MGGKQVTIVDVGCWLDSARGQYIGEEVQKIAIKAGFKMDFVSCNCDETCPCGGKDESHGEWYSGAWDDAEEYLNENVAPEGTLFYSNENGDWGLWETEED